MSRAVPLSTPLFGAAAVPGPSAASAVQAAAAVRIDRACTELRRGRPLRLALAIANSTDSTATGLLAFAVETLDEGLLRDLTAGGQALPRLLLSTQRLQALGWPHASTPQMFELPPDLGLLSLQQLAAVAAGDGNTALLAGASVDQPALHALLSVCKRARLVPALLLVSAAAATGDRGTAEATAQCLHFDLADVELAAPHGAAALRRVSDARVPLGAEEDCSVVLFREVHGDAEHVAVIVGQPPAGMPVPVRLHSACLTGDLLGSLRCDCGPQLQGAVARLAETGGVLLYLAQEGRGTGLANKLRAYRLQDGGLDTLQADRHLGFHDDERDFAPAAAMLQALGYRRIHLLTNNPHKIAALRRAGIEVVERWALPGPVNTHNAHYIHTKQQAGHLGSD